MHGSPLALLQAASNTTEVSRSQSKSQMQQQSSVETASDADVVCVAGRSGAGTRGTEVCRSNCRHLGSITERGPAVRICSGTNCSQLCKVLHGMAEIKWSVFFMSNQCSACLGL